MEDVHGKGMSDKGQSTLTLRPLKKVPQLGVTGNLASMGRAVEVAEQCSLAGIALVSSKRAWPMPRMHVPTISNGHTGQFYLVDHTVFMTLLIQPNRQIFKTVSNLNSCGIFW